MRSDGPKAREKETADAASLECPSSGGSRVTSPSQLADARTNALAEFLLRFDAIYIRLCVCTRSYVYTRLRGLFLLSGSTSKDRRCCRQRLSRSLSSFRADRRSPSRKVRRGWMQIRLLTLSAAENLATLRWNGGREC